jgi:hypothetical protein
LTSQIAQWNTFRASSQEQLHNPPPQLINHLRGSPHFQSCLHWVCAGGDDPPALVLLDLDEAETTGAVRLKQGMRAEGRDENAVPLSYGENHLPWPRLVIPAINFHLERSCLHGHTFRIASNLQAS